MVFLVVLIMAACFVGRPHAGLGAVITMLFGVAFGVAAGMVRDRDNAWLGMFLEAVAWITVGTALAYVVAQAVFAPGRITYHRIIGAVLFYLTIGQIFVGFYGVIALLAADSFPGWGLPGVQNSPAT